MKIKNEHLERVDESEVLTEQETEETEQEAEATEQESEATEETEEGSEEGAEGEASEAPTFQPTLKVRVMDKEYDIPEVLHAAIKDEETQRSIHDLVTKAYGFEHSKRQYPQLLEENRNTKSQLEAVERGFTKLQEKAQAGDPDSLLEVMSFHGVGEEKILNLAAHLLRLKEMKESRPDEYAAYEQAQRDRMQAGKLEYETQRYQQEALQAQAQLRKVQLEMELSRPDISEVASAYDQRAGQPGSFMARVVRTAQYHALTARKDLTPAEAIAEVMNELGYELVDEEAPQPTPVKTVQTQAQRKKLPVIPNTGGGGPSPVKKTVSSLADLRKLAAAARSGE